MRLCERGRSGFSLTEDGRLIFDASQNLFRSIDNFRSVVGSVRGELTGEVHFGTADAMWSNVDLDLSRAIRKFSEHAPKVIVHVDIASPQTLLQGLGEDRFHLILAPAQTMPQRCHAVMAFKEKQNLYCGRGHPLFAEPEAQIGIRELEACPYAARSYAIEQTGPLPISFEVGAVTSHMEGIALLILSGRYIGHLPTHFAQQWVESGNMRSLMQADSTFEDTFYLAFRKQEQNRATKLLFDCVLEGVAGH
jgi:DNA-binding transcriptional LysR family regulator